METTPFAATRSLYLVEDSATIRERLAALLAPVARLVGYSDNASGAIRDILAMRPRAVLLDLNLANGSGAAAGIGVLRTLKAEAPEIDVYVVTNLASPQYRRLCLHLGARGFFDKTTEFEKVRDAIAAQSVDVSESSDQGEPKCKQPS
jgi:DNA-binding NarL/FixJ family response regulator